VFLPSTSWLEEVGCKSTNTHLYLMPQVLDPPGEARSAMWLLRQLAERLGGAGFFPWGGEGGPDRPETGPPCHRPRHRRNVATRGRNAGSSHLARRLPGPPLPHAVRKGRAFFRARALTGSSCAPGARGPPSITLPACVPPGADADAVSRFL